MPQARPATRLRLIEAATHLMAGRSYSAAGVDELCRLAEAKKGSFYYFFPTKADLAVAALAHQWDRLREAAFEPIAREGDEGLDRVARLVRWMDARLRGQLAAGGAVLGCPFGHLGQEMAHQDPRIRQAVQTIFDAQCHFLRQWLDEAVRTRQVAAGDTVARARQVLALLEGAFILSKVANDVAVFAEVCQAVPAVAGRSAPAAVRIGTIPELL